MFCDLAVLASTISAERVNVFIFRVALARHVLAVASFYCALFPARAFSGVNLITQRVRSSISLLARAVSLYFNCEAIMPIGMVILDIL